MESVMGSAPKVVKIIIFRELGTVWKVLEIVKK